MAVQSIDVFVLEFANPEWQQSAGSDRQALSSSIAFTANVNQSLQTLSPNTASGSGIEGLLYVPDLFPSDPCFNISKQYVPKNVTRQANLPPNDYSLISLAPWISPNCTKSYLASANSDGARAFIFYLVQSKTPDMAPDPNDPSWGLNDGGKWKSQTKYAVYAVPSSMGSSLMRQISYYSGNMTDAPNGHLLTEQFDPRNYVRLYSTFNFGTSSQLPSLWLFLLIILGMLLFIIGLTSVLMQYIQRRRRQQLRRMIQEGHVDLEALGIKRLTVPQELLDKMPLFVYVASDPRQDVPGSKSTLPTPLNNVQCGEASLTSRAETALPFALVGSKSNLPSPDSPSHRQLPYIQPTCPICLDDFVSHSTIVRELPCGHIYHPECIDLMLKDYSSLCPNCKGKVLPAGYCPPDVTNSMVRRERLIRRMRERISEDANLEHGTGSVASPTISEGRRMPSFHRQFGRGNAVVRRRPSDLPQIALHNLPEQYFTLGGNQAPVSEASAQSATVISREEITRRRVASLVGQSTTAEEEDSRHEAGASRWRKAFKNIFPGFR